MTITTASERIDLGGLFGYRIGGNISDATVNFTADVTFTGTSSYTEIGGLAGIGDLPTIVYAYTISNVNVTSTITLHGTTSGSMVIGGVESRSSKAINYYNVTSDLTINNYSGYGYSYDGYSTSSVNPDENCSTTVTIN